MRTYNPTYKPNLNQLRRVADLVCKAESPVVIAGGGVISSNASKLLRYFVSTYQIPVTCTLMGLGAVSTADTLYLGMLGMHGTYTANKAVSNADLILAVGCRFDDRVTGRLDKFGKKAKIVHIDIDPTSIRKMSKLTCRLSDIFIRLLRS